LLAGTTRAPSALNAAITTAASCTSGGVTGWPVAASHTRAVRSSLAVTTRAPSALNAAWLTASAWPIKVTSGVPRAACTNSMRSAVDSGGRAPGGVAWTARVLDSTR